MGTSTSSAGAGAGAAFDPPWLDDADAAIDSSHADMPLEAPIAPAPADADAEGRANGADGESKDDQRSETRPLTPGGVAPSGRYKDARRLLTRFIGSGDRSDLRGAMSSFVNKGMGGPTRAASRMRTTSASASALGGFLAALRDGTDANINAWVASAKSRGLSAQDAALEIVNQLLPTGGSVDEESAKHSMDQAIAKLYEVDPNTDIFAMTDDQIAAVMAYTVAFDVYNRVQLELGRVFERLKYAARVVHERLAQVLDYIVAVVQGAMEKARAGSRSRSARDIADFALRSALDVFGAP